MTELRLDVGDCGACQRRDPVGGAANRMLSTSVQGAILGCWDWVPFPSIQASARVRDTIIDLVVEIDLKIAGGSLALSLAYKCSEGSWIVGWFKAMEHATQASKS